MRTIKIDDEVYSLLQANAKPFVDTENSTLRRMLGLDKPMRGTLLEADKATDNPLAEANTDPDSNTRTKAPKADLLKLVRSGRLREGEMLHLVDYQNTRVKNYQAGVNGKDLQFEGRSFSMSSLAKELLQKEGYTSDSVRGPSHWAKANGTTITELWEGFLSKQKR